MSELRFEWNERKNRARILKHGVSFKEAETVFSDEHGFLIANPDHSLTEDLYTLLGLSADLRTLAVCHR